MLKSYHQNQKTSCFRGKYFQSWLCCIVSLNNCYVFLKWKGNAKDTSLINNRERTAIIMKLGKIFFWIWNTSFLFLTYTKNLINCTLFLDIKPVRKFHLEIVLKLCLRISEYFIFQPFWSGSTSLLHTTECGHFALFHLFSQSLFFSVNNIGMVAYIQLTGPVTVVFVYYHWCVVHAYLLLSSFCSILYVHSCLLGKA